MKTNENNQQDSNDGGASLLKIQPSFLRKYLYEYCLIALAGCVVYLFLQLNSLQSYIRNDLSTQRAETVKTLYQNNILLERLVNRETK